MRGQLWQECPICGTEPVCVDCMLCAKHCDCEQRENDARQVRKFEQQNPGLLAKVQKHYEQGGEER